MMEKKEKDATDALVEWPTAPFPALRLEHVHGAGTASTKQGRACDELGYKAQWHRWCTIAQGRDVGICLVWVSLVHCSHCCMFCCYCCCCWLCCVTFRGHCQGQITQVAVAPMRVASLWRQMRLETETETKRTGQGSTTGGCEHGGMHDGDVSWVMSWSGTQACLCFTWTVPQHLLWPVCLSVNRLMDCTCGMARNMGA